MRSGLGPDAHVFQSGCGGGAAASVKCHENHFHLSVGVGIARMIDTLDRVNSPDEPASCYPWR